MLTKRLAGPLKGLLALVLVLAGTLTLFGGALADPTDTATIVATGVDEFGAPVRGNCFRVQGPVTTVRCDSSDGVVDGVAAFADLPFGNYTVSQNYTPIGFAAPSPNSASITLDTGGSLVPVSLTSDRTDLEITLKDGNGDPVLGACFNVSVTGYSRTLCDNSTLSGGVNGVTLLTFVPSGAVTVTQVSGPNTHVFADPQVVTITAGSTNQLLVEVVAIQKVTVTANTVDQFGSAVRGTCFRLSRNLYSVLRCDRDDLVVDGVASFANVTALDGYTIEQTYTPIGNGAPAVPQQTIDVTTVGPNSATFTSNRTDLEVTVKNGAGETLTGACIRVAFANYLRTMCDGLANSSGLNGVTLVTYAPAPSVTISMPTTPLGYQTMEVVSTNIIPGEVNALEVVLEPLRPTFSATLSVEDEAGNPITDADQGDNVTYVVSVQNTSTIMAFDLSVTDSRGTSYLCSKSNLAPDDGVPGGLDEAECSSVDTVSAVDRQAGSFVNTATVSASNTTTGSNSNEVTLNVRSATAEVSVSVFRAGGVEVDPLVDLVKRGETLTFSYQITNTGPSKLTGVSLDSSLLGAIVCDAGELTDGTLLNGEFESCTGTYVVTETDRVNGVVSDATEVVADQIDAPGPFDSVTLYVQEQTVVLTSEIYSDFGMTLLVAPETELNEGQTYYIRVTALNDTLETFHNMTLTFDPIAPLPTVCGPLTVAPGGSIVCNAIHEVTNGEAVAGTLSLDAEVTADEIGSPIQETVVFKDTNQAPVAATNPYPFAPVEQSGDLPADVFTMFGVSDPEGDSVSLAGLIEAGDGSTLTLNGLGFGTYDFLTTVDGSIEIVFVDANGAQLSVYLEYDADETSPDIFTPGDLFLEAETSDGATINETASATDDRDPDPLISCETDGGAFVEPGDVLAIGFYTISCIAEDGWGNSNGAAFNVEVGDTTDPTFNTIGYELARVEASDMWGAQVFYDLPTASDSVDSSVDVSCSPAPGSIFALGETVIECYAEDDSFNFTTGSFTVFVEDTVAPSISLSPESRDVLYEPGFGAYAFFIVSVDDAVDPVPSVVCTVNETGLTVNPDGDFYEPGMNTVSCQATDAWGNSATSNSIIIMVYTGEE